MNNDDFKDFENLTKPRKKPRKSNKKVTIPLDLARDAVKCFKSMAGDAYDRSFRHHGKNRDLELYWDQQYIKWKNKVDELEKITGFVGLM